VTVTAKPAHLQGLDGLRGVACLAVFVDHVEQYAEWLSWPHAYGPSLQALGRQGVELFFVLSGYLITYRMLFEQRARGRVSISAFYARRALRIWPLYYLVVLVAFVAVPWLMHHAAGAYLRDAWSWYLDGIPGDGRLLLYVVLLPHVAYFTLPPVLCATHLWSIGVEEQFYLVWPWLVRLAGRRPLAMFALVVLASFALDDLVFPWGEKLRPWIGGDALEHLRMYADHAHMEAMAIGAFVGWGALHEQRLLERLAADPVARVFAYLALPFGWYFYLNWHTQLGPALVYAFALAVLSHGPGSRFLGWKPVRALGTRSYALYLLHPFALFSTALAFERAGVLANRLSAWPFRVAALLLTLSFAEAAHRFVEIPALRMKDRLDRRTGRGPIRSLASPVSLLPGPHRGTSVDGRNGRIDQRDDGEPDRQRGAPP
jgi:peptidoglycan/LPS O-acetylase OafA/YrhL